MLPTNRAPTPPGEVLDEEFLKPMKKTQGWLAAQMGVSVQTVNLLINGKRAITAETALALSRVLETTAEFWMNLQNSIDLWSAKQRMARGQR